MYIANIVWLPEIVDKLHWKHRVVPDEVIEIFSGKPLYRKVQKGHLAGEDVYSAMAQLDSGRYLIVFFVYKATRDALILSAREMDAKERRYYERK